MQNFLGAGNDLNVMLSPFFSVTHLQFIVDSFLFIYVVIVCIKHNSVYANSVTGSDQDEIRMDSHESELCTLQRNWCSNSFIS